MKGREQKESRMVGSGRRRGSHRVAVFASLAIAASGCDFSGTAPAAGATITLSTDTVTIAQGTTGSVIVTLDGLDGFADQVDLVVEGLPAGVTAGTLSLAAGQTTGALTLTVAYGVSTGTSELTVHAHSSTPGFVVATAALSLVIEPGGPGFTMSFGPAIVGIPQGASRTSTVTLSRWGGFVGGVDLAATALPPGVTALMNPSSVYAATATLTLTASATAALGAGTVTLTGTSTVGSQAGTITVNVTSGAGASTGNVSMAFCPLLGVPIWVAFQDGSGPWVLSTETNGSYSGQVSTGRGGVAYVVAGAAGGFELHAHYGTTAEAQALGEVLCYGSTGTGKSVNVIVSGTVPTDVTLLGLGTSSTTSSLGTGPPFSNVPEGSIDLVGARGSFVGSALVHNKLFVQRAITPTAGSTVVVDFNGSNAVAPITGTATVVNLGADQATVSGAYRTPNRTFFRYAFDTPSTAASRSFGGFPTSAGSLHLVQVDAAPNFQSFDRKRTAAAIYAAVGDRTLTLGGDLGAVAVAQAGVSPPLRLEAVVPTTSYNGAWSVTFWDGSGAQYRSALVRATSGYIGGTLATVKLVVPDLSTVAGYNNSWGLAEAETTNWFVVGQNAVGFGAQGQWQDGATLQSGARYGTFSHH